MTDPTQRDGERDASLGALLRQLAEDPADEGFSARLHVRLAQAGAPAAPGLLAKLRAWIRQHPVPLGVLSGVASGCAAFALMSALTSDGAPHAVEPERAALRSCEPAQATAEVFVVPEGKVALVQLHFAVERAVDAAEFSVLLPEGLAFFSDGAALPERVFRWSSPLGKGDNQIPIAVVGTRPGRHHLTATAMIGGEVVVHDVVLDVRTDA